MQTAYKKGLQSNIWKYFLFSLTWRRQFFPILAIYFMTLPNSTAQQIGFYSAVGAIVAFFLEIPSGYFADKFGHKKTLILAKVFLLLSTFFFVIANSLPYFILGSIFLSLGFAFASGTNAAFMHETLSALKREKEYGKVMSKIEANVSLLSGLLMFLLPMLTAMSIRLPLQVNLGFDVIGLFVAMSLCNPKKKKAIYQQPFDSLWTLLKNVRGISFYPVSIFIGSISGFLVASSQFREVYLQSLGFPIVIIGAVMGISRFVWFILGHQAHIMQKRFTLKQIFLFELFLFPVVYVLIAYFSNPYVVGALFALFIGYTWARGQVINHYLIRDYIPDKRYKATLLSVKAQMSSLIHFVIVFLIGFVMAVSYKLGHAVLGVALFIILLIAYSSIKFPKSQARRSKVTT